MNAVAAKTLYTPEELLAHPDEKDYELVDGHLVKRKMSALSSWVAGRLHRYLDVFCDDHQRGWAFPEGTGYQCFPGAPLKVRKPDASFIPAGRLPATEWTEGYSSITPDLVVEVISPNDAAWEIDEKVAEWLDAGVALIWVVHPRVRAVRIHRASGPVSWLSAEDELSGEDVLPGFRTSVAAIFPPSAVAEAGPDRT
jgi:Uma2 family endonuclease